MVSGCVVVVVSGEYGFGSWLKIPAATSCCTRPSGDEMGTTQAMGRLRSVMVTVFPVIGELWNSSQLNNGIVVILVACEERTRGSRSVWPGNAVMVVARPKAVT